MSAILDFYDVYNFETYINEFLDLEYPIFDPKHGFLSSVEAEIISFCQIHDNAIHRIKVRANISKIIIQK